MKSLRKYFGMIALALCVCFCVCSPLPKNNLSASADNTTTQEETLSNVSFTISNSSSSNEVIFTSDSSTTNNYSTFNEGFEATLQGITEKSILQLTFDDFSTSEPMQIFSNEFVNEIFVSGSASGNNDLFKVIGTETLNITISNSTFNSNNDNSYAFVISNPNSKICLTGNIENNTKYFANGGIGTFTTSGTLENTKKLTIAIPFDPSILLFTAPDNISTLENYIEVVPEVDFFEISSRIVNGNYVVGATLKLELDDNEGELSPSYTVPSTLTLGQTFPTAEQISKEHSTFVGWFGKVNFTADEISAYNLSSSTYYFNKEMADRFLKLGNDVQNIENIFAKTTTDFELAQAISGYQTAEDSHINLFVSLKKIPTYIAVWSENQYTITFNTNGADELPSITAKFNAEISLPTPTRQGYEFNGWYLNSALTYPCNFSDRMPDNDVTLYAKWTILSYSITFMNNGNTVDVINANFGESLNLPTLEAEVGYKFVGWVDENDILFTSQTMPDKNLTLYAKFQKIKYSIYINSMGGQTYSAITLEYGSPVPKPNSPTKVGAIFDGWYADSGLTIPFNFEGLTMPAKNQTIFAKWKSILYYVHFVTNSPEQITSLSLVYGESITLPTPSAVKGKTFGGWFADRNLTTEFSTISMPNANLTVYAKWNDKLTVSIDTSAQTYEITDFNTSFNRFSNLEGFRVQYKVDGEWTFNAPTKVGTYDVKVVRNEDNTYAAFETIIEKGFILTGEKINLSWLIIILFIITGLELLACIIIRAMRQMKKKMTIVAFVPFFSYLLPTDQFVLLIISGVLALFMFILTIYEIVKLHNTLPEIAIKKEKAYSNNISESEVFESYEAQDNNNDQFKQEEAFGTKYSANDIEHLLYNDDYREKHTKPENINPNNEDKPYQSAIDKAKQNSINRKFDEDENDDSVELQDKNGQFESQYQSISKIKTYDTEYDDWRSHIQTDIPND